MPEIGAITGIKEVLARMHEASEKMGRGCARGLKKAGLRLQRESQRLVPVDYGVLKASAFTRSEGEGFGTAVTVGYTAAYAVYVHENVEMKLKGEPRNPPHKGRYWDPQGRGQSKFLEEPVRRLNTDMRADIIKEMHI